MWQKLCTFWRTWDSIHWKSDVWTVLWCRSNGFREEKIAVRNSTRFTPSGYGSGRFHRKVLIITNYNTTCQRKLNYDHVFQFTSPGVWWATAGTCDERYLLKIMTYLVAKSSPFFFFKRRPVSSLAITSPSLSFWHVDKRKGEIEEKEQELSSSSDKRWWTLAAWHAKGWAFWMESPTLWVCVCWERTNLQTVWIMIRLHW